METIDQMTGDQADDDDSPVVIVEDHHGLFAEIVIADHRWLDLLDGDFRTRLAAAFRACLNKAGIEAAEWTILLSDDASVAELNMAHRGKNGATNVLSFPDDDDDDFLGDIALAWGVMEGEAAGLSISMTDHALHLMVHGVLHLLGHDHQDDAEATTMEQLEISILGSVGVADPYDEARE